MLEISDALYKDFSFADTDKIEPADHILRELEHSRIGRTVKKWLLDHAVGIDINKDIKGAQYIPYENIELGLKGGSLKMLVQIAHEARHAWQLSQMEKDFYFNLDLNPSAYIVFHRLLEADAYSFENMFAYYHLTERGFDTEGFFNVNDQTFDLAQKAESDLRASLTKAQKAVLARRRLFDGYFIHPDESQLAKYDRDFFEHECECVDRILKVLSDVDNFDFDTVDFVPEISADCILPLGEVIGFDTPSMNMFTHEFAGEYNPYDAPYGTGLATEILDFVKTTQIRSQKSDRALEFSARAFRPMVAAAGPAIIKTDVMPIPLQQHIPSLQT